MSTNTPTGAIPMHATHHARALLVLSSIALGACASDGAPRPPGAPGFDTAGKFRPLPALPPNGTTSPAHIESDLAGTYARAKAEAVEHVAKRQPDAPHVRYYGERDDERTRALAGGRVVTISFEAGSARLQPFMAEQFRIFSLLPYAARIELRGRTDGTGSQERNERVALARAEAARGFLLARGVPSHMIGISYRATGDYTGDVTTDVGRRASRRVEIEFVPPVDAVRSEWYAMTGHPCPWQPQTTCNGDDPR